MPSFRRALELGAMALEMDAHVTSDGHVVISHDPHGERLAGVKAAIRETTLADVQRWDLGARFVSRGGDRFAGRGYRVPTFEEVLVELPGVPINVDIKQHDLRAVEAMLALLRRLGGEERVLLASFDTRTLREVRRRGFRGRTGIGQTEAMRLLALPAAVQSLLPRMGDAAQIPTRVGALPLGRRWMIERCHAIGMRVDYWTVDDPAEARALLALGADGIMTDDVAAIAPVFAELAQA